MLVIMMTIMLVIMMMIMLVIMMMIIMTVTLGNLKQTNPQRRRLDRSQGTKSKTTHDDTVFTFSNKSKTPHDDTPFKVPLQHQQEWGSSENIPQF